MAEGQIEELGVNLSVTDGDKFATDLTEGAKALDKFDASATKIIDKAEAINTAFGAVASGITHLKEVIAQGIDMKAIDAALASTLAGVRAAQRGATAQVKSAPVPNLKQSGIGDMGTGPVSVTSMGGIGQAAQKASDEVRKATLTIDSVFDDMEKKVSAQTRAASSSMRSMGEEAQAVASQVGASFKTAFEVVAAFQARTLERTQIQRRSGLQGAVMDRTDKLETGAMIDTQAISDWERYDKIVKDVTTTVEKLRSGQEAWKTSNLAEETILEQIGIAQTKINEAERQGVNDLRMLSVETGTYTDRLKEQLRQVTLINSQNVGAKSTLAPTRAGVVDAGSESLIKSIQDRSQKALSSIAIIAEKSNGLDAVLQRQVAIEEAASTAETAIYATIDETVGKSVDYRKMKLREVLATVTETTAALIAESRKEMSEGEAKLAFDQAFAATEQKIQQAQLARHRALVDAKLNIKEGTSFSQTIDLKAKQELLDLANIRERALTLGPGDHGLLNELREIGVEAKAATVALREQVKAAIPNQEMSIAAAARARSRNQIEGMTAQQFATGKVQLATQSDNAMVRTFARTIQAVEDATAAAKLSMEAFGIVIRKVFDTIYAISAPVRLVVGILNLFGVSLEKLIGVGTAVFRLFGGKKLVDPFMGNMDVNQSKMTENIRKMAPGYQPGAVFNKGDSGKAKEEFRTLGFEIDQVDEKAQKANKSIFDIFRRKKEAGTGGATEQTIQVQADTTQAEAKVKVLGEHIQVLRQQKAVAVEQVQLGAGSIEQVRNLETQIQGAVKQHAVLVTEQKRVAQAARETGTAMTTEASGATKLATGLDEAGRKAQESTGKIAGMMNSLKGGFIQGIGVGIGNMITSSIMMSFQNMFFTLGSSLKSFISEAFTSIQNREREIMGITALMQKEIANTKGYDNLAMAADEATGKAKELYAWVEKLAILSPFNKEQLVGAFQTAMAFDFTAKNAKILTQAVTDFATTSKLGPQAVNNIIESLGKMKNAGTVYKRDLLEITGAGLSVIPLLAKKMNMDTGELMQKVHKGALDAKQTIEIIVKELQEKYGGNAAKSGGTLQGLINSLDDLKAKMLDISLTPLTESLLKPLLMFLATAGQTKEVAAIFERAGQSIKAFGENTVRYAVAGFYVLREAIAAIPEPLKEFYHAWSSVSYVFIGVAAALLVIPPILAGLGAVLLFFLSPLSLLQAGIAALYLAWQHNFYGIRDVTTEVMTYVRESLSALPEFLAEVVSSAIEVIYQLPEGFANVMRSVVEYGTAIIRFFAQGIVQAASFVIKALNYIGSIIKEWLQPHSPPKLLPDLETWGKQAADVYFKGWTKADMGMFTDLSGMLEKAVGAIRPDGLSPAGTKRIRETIANAIQGFKLTGNLDETGLRDVGGRFNNEIINLARAYVNAAKSANILKTAQDELKSVTEGYDKKLEPLQNRLKAIQATMSSFDIASQIKELQNVLSNKFATGDQKEQAQAKIDEFNIQKKINDLDAEKASKTAAIQERINKATEENRVAQESVDLLKDRFDQQISIIALEQKQGAGGGDESDAAKKGKKPPKPKKVKEQPVVNTDQPVFDELALTELPDAGLGGLGDVLAKAKEDMKGVFGGLKEAIKPATDAINDLKTAAEGVGSAFAKGFSGGEGGALSGVQSFAFNVGTYLGAAVLSLNTAVTAAANFGVRFSAAFNVTEGSIGQKIIGALNATGVTAAVQKFIADILLPTVAFPVKFAMGFFLTQGSIQQRIEAGLAADQPNVEAAIKTFRDAIIAKIDEGVKFATAFVTAFTVTNGSLVEKFTAALVATGITAQIATFRTTILGAIDSGGKFADQFYAAFTLSNGNIVQKFTDALQATGVTAAINTFKTNVFTAVKEAFGGSGQGEHGRGGSGLSIDLSSIQASIVNGIAAFDFKGKLDVLKTNVKSALDLLFGAGTGEAAESILVDVQAKLDLLFGSVKFSDLKTSFDNLVASVKDTIKGIEWKKPMEGVFGGLTEAVTGAIKAVFSLGKKDLKGTDQGLEQMSMGVGKAATGGTQIVDTIVNQIVEAVDISLVLAGIGAALGKIISGAVSNVEAIVGAISATRSGDKQEMTTAQIVGKTIAEAVVGIIAAVFAFIATTDWLQAIKDVGSVITSLAKIASDLVLGFEQGIADAILDLVGTINPDIKKKADELKGKIDEGISTASKTINTAFDGINKLWQDILDKIKKVFGGGDEKKPTAGETVLGGDKTGKDAGSGAASSFFTSFADFIPKLDTAKLYGPFLTEAPAAAQAAAASYAKNIETTLTGDVKPEVLWNKYGDAEAQKFAQETGGPTGEAHIAGVIAGAEKAGPGFLASLWKLIIEDPLILLEAHSPSKVTEGKLGFPIGQGIVAGTNRGIKEGGDLLAGTKTSFTTSYTAIKTLTDSFSAALKTKYTAIKTDSTKIATDMSTALKKIFSDMRDAILLIIDDLRDKAIADFEAVSTAGSKKFEELKTAVVKIIKDMDEAIVKELETLGAKIDVALSGAVSALFAAGGAKDKFVEAGRKLGVAFVLGVAAGVRDNDANNALAQAIRDMVLRAKEAGQTTAKLSSPSRLFRDEIGRKLAQGVTAGIADEAPNAANAMSNLVEAVITRAKGGGNAYAALSGILSGAGANLGAFALPSVTLNTPQANHKTYVLQMNVTPSQVESVVINYAAFEAMAG